MGKASKVGIVLGVLGVAVAIATLALAVVILIKVNNNSTTTAPATTAAAPLGTTQVNRNIPEARPINSSNQQFPAYHSAVTYYQKSVNFSYDPCNDFYNYACANYGENWSDMSFDLLDKENMINVAKGINAQTNPTSTALQKLKIFFDICNATAPVINATIADGSQILAKVNAFATETGLTFTWATATPAAVTLPSATTLAKALAYLSAKEGVDTLVSPGTDVELVPDQPKHFKFYLDQNTLVYPKAYYPNATFNTIRDKYEANVIDVFNRYLAVENVTGVTNATIVGYVNKIFQLEQLLASSTYSTDDTTRRLYNRTKLDYTIAKANTNFPFVDWQTYLHEIYNKSGVHAFSDDAGFTFYVKEESTIEQLSADILKKNVPGLEPETIVNYLFFRLLLDNKDILPVTPTSKPFHIVTSRQRTFGKDAMRRRDPFESALDAEDVAVKCSELAEAGMQYAVARVFTDIIYPTPDAKERIHNATNKIAQSIRTSFETMLDGLDWMDAASKQGAYAKVADLVVNIAYPPWILDNTTLDNYHAALDITTADTFFSIQDKFTVFANYLQYSSTNSTVMIDRTVFNGPPSTVNAWYQPEFNSITFPEGILQMPFFNPDWPASLNFGAMGLVSGHELTHGFDDQGVQWNSKGGLNNWLDASSAQGFKQMASCVIDEYGKFCPLNATQYSPNCLNGENTQGENIADNGGIHASFRAYRTHVNLNGPDPQLPDPVFGQFTHDQLFFLQFGQIWCQAPPKPADIFTQILVDVHSPSLYRVFGSIQNFPAFRNAYHCPYDSKYSPAQHCNVWVPFHPY